MLHLLLQDKNMMPDEVYNKPRGVKNFIYASTLLRIEQEEKEANKPKSAR
jgi:hypothetical protein